MYTFMDNETYDQIELTKDQLGSALNFLKENMDISLQSFKGNIIGITLPNSVNLEVVEYQYFYNQHFLKQLNKLQHLLPAPL